MSASSVVGPFDPGDDRDAKLIAGGPAAPVEHVLLEQREERLHGRVVAGGTDLAHRPDHLVTGERPVEFAGAKLRPAVRMQNATGHVPTTGCGVVERGDSEAGFHAVID